MPSSYTLTASDFITASGGLTLTSTKWNSHMGVWRGHFLPIDPTATSLANNSYDLGCADYQWRVGNINQIVMVGMSTPASNPTSGSFKLFADTSGNIKKLNSSGQVSVLGGGGGGGSISWTEDSSAPIADVYSNSEVYIFGDDLFQYLYTLIRVPSGYSPGSQISLKVLFSQPTSGSDILLQTVSTLIRTGTDAITSTTNQRTSTNSTQSITSANIPYSVTFDLSDSSGRINSVTISAGDLIKVRLTRGTDNSTYDAYLYPYSAEATFT